MVAAKSVQVFGRKKTATAVAFTKEGNGIIKVNGVPIDLVQPVTLRYKVGFVQFCLKSIYFYEL